MSWRQGGEGGREKEAEGEGALVLSEPGYTVQSSYHRPVSEPDPDPHSSSPVGLVPRLTTIQLLIVRTTRNESIEEFTLASTVACDVCESIEEFALASTVACDVCESIEEFTLASTVACDVFC